MKKSRLTERTASPPPVPLKMLWQRAGELAMNHGRSADNPTEDDFTQARRELACLPVGNEDEARENGS